MTSWRRLLAHLIFLAPVLPRAIDGSSNAAKIAIRPITTSSSTRVKAAMRVSAFHGLVVRNVAVSDSNGRFPLTRALSLGLPTIPPLPNREGWGGGKRAVQVTNSFLPNPRFLESGHLFFDAHWDHEPVPLSNDGRRDLPLPKGEGLGEGEPRVRITNRARRTPRFLEREVSSAGARKSGQFMVFPH